MDAGLITLLVIAILAVLFLAGLPIFAALGAASVAGILIRGKNAVVEEGTEFTAYSNQNRTIQP